MFSKSQTFAVTSELAQQTLAAVLRRWLPGQSWSQIGRLVESRRVRIDGELCLDPARRMREGLTVEVLEPPTAPSAAAGGHRSPLPG